MSSTAAAPVFAVPNKFVVRYGFSNDGHRQIRISDVNDHELAWVPPQSKSTNSMDISVFADEAATRALLYLHPEKGANYWGNTFRACEASTDAVIGSIAHSGLRSFVQDEWQLLTSVGEAMGWIRENLLSALVHRASIPLFPQRYTLKIRGRAVARIRHNWSSLEPAMEVQATAGFANDIDSRFLLAATVLVLSYSVSRETGRTGPRGF